MIINNNKSFNLPWITVVFHLCSKQKKEVGTFLCYISVKKRQCNFIFSKKHLILSIQIKKNP